MDRAAVPMIRWALPTVARRVALLLIAFGLGACGEAPPKHFVLLSMDTLRADHLGSYGYDRETSPQLDRFAAEGTRYANAFAPAPWTLPSHVAMLSGRHPYDAGIVNWQSAVPARIPMVAELLKAAGYATAAFVDSPPRGFVGGERGFGRGFDRYRHAPHQGAGDFEHDMQATVDAGLRWLSRRDPGEPFFLFLHTKSIHATPARRKRDVETAPYDQPPPWRGRFLAAGAPRFPWREGLLVGVKYLELMNERLAFGSLEPDAFSAERIQELVDLYDAGIVYADDQVGRLLAGLDAQGLAGDTVVIATADHGEAFLEHAFFLHKELHDELLRVPLLVRDPARPGGRVVEAPVELADVGATILARAGVAAPPGITGRPLPESDAEADPARPIFSYFHFQDGYFYEAFGLRQGSWKLVQHKRARDPAFRTELFDTSADSAELEPVAGEELRRQAMREALSARFGAALGEVGEQIEVDDEAMERLRALGYLP